MSRLALECCQHVRYLLDDSNAFCKQVLGLSAEKFPAPFYHLPRALILQNLKVGNRGVDSDALYQED